MEPESLQDLEQTLAEVAEALFAPGTVEATLQRVVALAVATVSGCDVAGIFLVENEQVTTSACSDRLVLELDGLQFEYDEGPCLDAVSEADTFYAEDLAGDPRWPRFGPAAAAAGMRSLLAFRLQSGRLSALNLYGREPGAFGAFDRATGLLFSKLAGIALASAEERHEGDVRAQNLEDGLRTREVIGQAQGILMERERITADEAFAVLRQASQRMNIKLREVAQTLVETGTTPGENSEPEHRE